MTETARPSPHPLADHERVLAVVRRSGQPVGASAGGSGEVASTEPSTRSSAGPTEPADPAQPAELLSALGLLRGLRAHLDDLELALIEGARERRVSWSQISSALGLASRQAAEQRWLRLSGAEGRNPARTRAARQRQRSVDESFGELIAPLRVAARAAYRQLRSDPDWDRRHPRAALARHTLDLAGTAPPSALFTLAEEAVADLERIPARQLGAAGADALRRLRRAIAAVLTDIDG